MKYVVVRPEFTGYWPDPRPYLAVMPCMGEALPPRARVFAESPGHYDFSSIECVKDPNLVSVERGPDSTATVTFAANRWKHDQGLTLTYRDVTAFAPDPETVSAQRAEGSMGASLAVEVWEHEGRHFEVVMASDVINDGMGVELTDLGSSESGRRAPAEPAP
jgi:hypothetical protein